MIKINFGLLQPTKTSFEALLKSQKKTPNHTKKTKPHQTQNQTKKTLRLFLGKTHLFQKLKLQVSDGHFPLVSSHAHLQNWTTN